MLRKHKLVRSPLFDATGDLTKNPDLATKLSNHKRFVPKRFHCFVFGPIPARIQTLQNGFRYEKDICPGAANARWRHISTVLQMLEGVT